MKIGVTCNLDDQLTAEVLRDNDPIQLMDLFASAVSGKRKLVLLQVDASGVTFEREYPTPPVPPAERGARDKS